MRANAPFHTSARGGIEPVEGGIAQRRILLRTHEFFPDVEIDDIRMTSFEPCAKALRTQILYEQSVDVVAARTERKIAVAISVAWGEQRKAAVIFGAAEGTKRVAHHRFEAVQNRRCLFVPVRIELHTALLHQHAIDVPARIERLARKIALHGSPTYRTSTDAERNKRREPAFFKSNNVHKAGHLRGTHTRNLLNRWRSLLESVRPAFKSRCDEIPDVPG